MQQTDFYTNPKFFEVVIRATGLLSGVERTNRIKQIAKKNIWLASCCKNSCVNQEEEIIDWLIIRCSRVFLKFGDLQFLIALFEIGEYKVIGYLLEKYFNLQDKGLKNAMVSFCLSETTSISDVLSFLSLHIPKEFFLSLFYRLRELGYNLSAEAYNSVIRVSENEKALEYIAEMQSKGIDPNCNTYFNLLQSEHDLQRGIVYFDKFIEYFDYDKLDKKTEKQFTRAYTKLISLSEEYSFVLEKKSELEFFYENQGKNFPKNLHMFLTESLIRTSSEDKVAEQLFNQVREELANKQSKGIHFEILYHLESCSSFKEKLEFYIVKYFSKKKPGTKKCEFVRFQVYKAFTHSLYKYFDDCIYSVFELLKKFDIAPQIQHYSILIQQNKTLKSIDYFIENNNLTEIDPRVITKILDSIDYEKCRYLLDILKASDYPINLFIYNVLLKKADYSDSLVLLSDLKTNYLKPDIFSYSPLFKKWNTVEDLFVLIRLAQDDNVQPDYKIINSIEFRLSFLNLESDFIIKYYDKKKSPVYGINYNWKVDLEKINEKIINKSA